MTGFRLDHDRRTPVEVRVEKEVRAVASVEQLKNENIQHIRRLFYKRYEPWTRPDLAKASGLSMGGTTNILRILLERKEVLYLGDAPSTGGRKSKLYGLNPDFAHVGAVLLSHRDEMFSVVAVSTDLSGKVILRQQEDTEKAPDFEMLASMVRTLFESDRLLKCFVVSFPGIVSSDGVATSSDFPGLGGLNIRKKLEAVLNVPVEVENDVNLAVVAYGRTHPACENLAILYQPKHDPAGVGLWIHGRLHRGREGLAGEIGRIERNAQMKLLASDPKSLVRMQIDILNCLLAPDRIAWSCPMLEDGVDFSMDNAVPEVNGPVLERVKDLETLTRQGAEILGKEELLSLPFKTQGKL